MHLLMILITLGGVTGVFDLGEFEGDGSPNRDRWACEKAAYEMSVKLPVPPPGSTLEYVCEYQTET